jgi:glutamate/tyrosine decarboxylase-like PLP-dependent enzyme
VQDDYVKALKLAAQEAIRKRDAFQVESPVYRTTADELRAAFGGPVPERGTPAREVIADLVGAAEPGLSGETGPRFFAWVIGASNPVGVAADWLTSMWGQNAGNYFCSPAAAVCEEVVGGWLLDLLDLPRGCSVGLVSGATMANFSGIATGRHEILRRAGWDVEEDGLFGAPEVSVIIGEEAHATVFAALQFTGLGRRRVVGIPPGSNKAMDTAACLKAIEACAGPTIVVLQAGHINSGSFDAFAEIIPAARARGAWVHVDGAFGLWARACPQLSRWTEGIEQADSWAVDGHKWLQTPYDCGYVITRMTIAASYLPVEGAPDPSHYVPELSRRARGFATWAVIRHLGREGIVRLVEGHCELARHMAEQLAREPGVEVLNEVVLNQFVVRFGDDDGLTRRVIEEVLREGTCFVRGALWDHRWVMRVSLISGPTTRTDVKASVEAILRAWKKVRAASGR